LDKNPHILKAKSLSVSFRYYISGISVFVKPAEKTIITAAYRAKPSDHTAPCDFKRFGLRSAAFGVKITKEKLSPFPPDTSGFISITLY